MKKVWLRLLSALTAMCFLFGLAACGETEGPSGSTSASQTSSLAPTEEPTQNPPRPANEGLEFSRNEGETGYLVTGLGSCTDADLVIPSEHDGKPVTGIGDSAFARCEGLRSVVIGDSVQIIGFAVFYDCDGLTSVVIGDSVQTIGDSAFRDCDGLTSVVIGDGVQTIEGGAFAGCDKLTDLYYRGTEAQWNAIEIGNRAIPDGVTVHYAYTGA